MTALIISQTCLVQPKLSLFEEPAGLKQLLCFLSLCSYPAVYLKFQGLKESDGSTVETTE